MENIIKFLKEEKLHEGQTSEANLKNFKQDLQLFYGEDIPEEVYQYYKECSGIYDLPFVLYDFGDILDFSIQWVGIIEEYLEEEVIGDFIAFGEDNGDKVFLYSFKFKTFGITDKTWFSEENYLPLRYSSFSELLYDTMYFDHLSENSVFEEENEEN